LKHVVSRFGKKRGPRRYQKLRDIHIAKFLMPCGVSFLAQTSKAVIFKHAIGLNNTLGLSANQTPHREGARISETSRPGHSSPETSVTGHQPAWTCESIFAVGFAFEREAEREL
jgi:hypothetical protein